MDGRSMHKLRIRQSFDAHWSLGQGTQPFQIFPGQLIVGPLRSQSRHGIEISNVDQAAHRLVVIAADEEFPQPTRALNDFIGTRPVANDIAQNKDQVVGWSGREASLKSFEITMNIA